MLGRCQTGLSVGDTAGGTAEVAVRVGVTLPWHDAAVHAAQPQEVSVKTLLVWSTRCRDTGFIFCGLRFDLFHSQ